ncbi:hypothetical protein H5410_047399 [Solanum commersonii]|uniref:Uncharacterized protein n=1 Tax=Solanum commersonii TaxID=4109 RepID=A0A9J5XGZ8_SOLCO|nr:hypothetical protein H5410_047399 [Solanum commersonii]
MEGKQNTLLINQKGIKNALDQFCYEPFIQHQLCLLSTVEKEAIAQLDLHLIILCTSISHDAICTVFD